MKIKLEELDKGMVVSVKYAYTGDDMPTEEVVGIITDIIHYPDERRAASYIEYRLLKVVYQLNTLEVTSSDGEHSMIILKSEEDLLPECMSLCEITYLGTVSLTLVWRYDSDKSALQQQLLEEKFITNIKHKVKDVLTTDEFNTLLSLGGN